MSKKRNVLIESQKGKSEIFYKYQKITADKFPLKNLENNELYFRSPTEFNDPYDSLSDIIYEGMEDEFSCFLPPDEKYKNEEGIYSVNPGIYSQDKNNSKPIELRKNLKICCFSKHQRSLLLWSHYADYHRGICFGFEGKYLGNEGKNSGLAQNRKCYSFDLETEMIFSSPIFYEVKYQDSLPKQLNMVTTKKLTPLLDFVLTKQSDWAYEQEYRLIDLTADESLYKIHKFKKETLKEVILGIKTPEPVIKCVIDIIKKEYLQKEYTVEVYQMKPLDRKYAIIPEKIDLDTF